MTAIMAYPDKLFCSEFRQMMNDRSCQFGGDPRFHLVELPMPEMRSLISPDVGDSLAIVNGVKEEYFSLLNGCSVRILKKGTFRKRQIGSDGKFLTDRNGDLVYTQVPVPHDSVAILSSKCIKLRNSVVENGVLKKYEPTKGFKYVDYKDIDGKRRYIYIIPKMFVYHLNTCALVLSQNSLRNFYKGYKLALQNGNYVYLYVVPTSRLRQTPYRVLGLKFGTNFSQEINAILRLWQSLGVMFDISKTAVGSLNLGVTSIEGNLYIEDFVKIGESLSSTDESDEFE